MNTPKFASPLLAVALLAPCAGAIAQSDAARDRQLAEARAELARAARKVAELSREASSDIGEQVRAARQNAFHIERRPVLGVVLVPDANAGVRIGGITPDSAAARAGLKSGDRIVGVGGTEVLGNNAQLRVDNTRRLLAGLKEGKPVDIAYVRDGRKTTARVTPELDDRVFVFNDADGSLNRFSSPVSIHLRKDGAMEIDSDAIEGKVAIDTDQIQKQVDRALVQIARSDVRNSHGVGIDALNDAFRWNGLNLATVDPQLGRYFGTARGVLVLSTGSDLPELQAGDVIRRIDDKDVNTPREAMAALRAKPADSRIQVEYLRDRKSAVAQIKAPKPTTFFHITPSTPPTPPTPATPTTALTPPTPPAAPAPPAEPL